MSGQITDIFCVFAAGAPEEGVLPIGKVCGSAFLWLKRGEGPAITGLKVVHEGDDEEAIEGYTKLDVNLNKTNADQTPVYLYIRHGGESSPLVDIKICTSKNPLLPAGFIKVPRAVNPGQIPREFFGYQTRAAFMKIDTNDYDVNDRLDCLDGHSWRTARVLKVRHEGGSKDIFLNFDGWAEKWNEWVAVTSPRIAPLHHHTKGKWTGSGALPFNFSDHMEMFTEISESIYKIAAREKYSLTSDEYSFLCVENKKFLLECLSATINDPTVIPQIQKYIQANLKIIVGIINYAPELSDEMVSALNHIFNRQETLYMQHGNTGDEKIEKGKFAVRNTTMPQSIPSAYQIANINYFGEIGGFDAIRSRLMPKEEELTKEEEGKEEAEEDISKSFVNILMLISTVSFVKDLLVVDFAKSFVETLDLTNLVTHGLQHITDGELRILSKDALTRLTTDVQKLLRLITTDLAIAEFIEKIKLDIALRLLSADVLKEKVNGMNSLALTIQAVNMKTKEQYRSHNESVDRYQSDDDEVGGEGTSMVVDDPPLGPLPDPNRRNAYSALNNHYASRVGGGSSSSYAYAAQRNQNQVESAKHLTAEYMVKWIEENNVVSVVLGREQHEQVIKRSPVILKFLAQNAALTSAHIDLLWSTANNRHEQLVRIVYETLADIAEELTEEQLDFLYARIQKKPLGEYKDFDVQYVKLFTMNAVKATRGKNKWYGLDLFWSMVQDENVAEVPVLIREQARIVLKEMLSQHQFSEQRNVYILKCVEGIKTSQSSVQCISLLKLILEIDSESEETIQELQNSQQLVEILLAEAARYNKLAAQEKKEKNIEPSQDVIYTGIHSHRENIHTRLEFLYFILAQSPLLLSRKNIDELWDVLVLNSVDTIDIIMCVNWLKSAVFEKKSFSILNKTLTAHVFSELLSKQHTHVQGYTVPINKAWFDCFQMYFIMINHKKSCLLSASVDWLVVTKFDELVGLDMLWNFTLAADHEVSTIAKHFLTTLHIRLDFNFQNSEKKDIYAGFVDKCMTKLGEATKGEDTQQATEMISLLAGFLERVESGEALKRPLFFAGEKVRALWKNTRDIYSAKINEVNPDGSYQVKYDDGDFDGNCPEHNLFTTDEKKKEGETMSDQGDAHLYPRSILSNRKEYFDLFFELLGKSGDLGHRVWKLLENLPTNAAMKAQIEELSSVDEKAIDWKEVLPADSIIKLLYTLQIVQDQMLLQEDDADSNNNNNNNNNEENNSPSAAPSLARQTSTEVPPLMQKWCKMFVNSGGFVHMYNVYMNYDFDQIFAGELQMRCFAMILNLLKYFLIGNANTIGVEGTHVQTLIDSNNFVARLLATLQAAVSVDASLLDKNGATVVASSVANILKTIGALLTIVPSLLDEVHKFSHWQEVLDCGLLKNQNSLIRTELADSVINLCVSFDDEKKYPRTPRSVFEPILLKQLASLDTSDSSVHTIELFMVLEALLTSSKGNLSIDAAGLASNLTKMIQMHPLLEATEKDVDPVLCSLLSLATQLLRKAPLLKELVGAQAVKEGEETLLENVITSLFALPQSHTTGSSDENPPKCKSAQARSAAFTLLAEFSKGNNLNTSLIVKLLTPNHLQSHSKKVDEWKFSPVSKEEKGRQGYVGLRNLGCICYLNASFQQLFMIPQLRKNILAVTEYDDPDAQKSLIYQIQYVMAHLQESGKQYIDPRPLTDIWPDDTGKPINVGRQEDANSFLTRFIDTFNEKVKKTAFKNTFQDVMGATFSHQMFGNRECKHFKARDEPFYVLNIEIKNKKTLKEGLDAMVEGEVMEGDNAYRCDKCGKKVDSTVRRQCIKTLPPTLIISMKRFELDYETWQSVKVNDRVEFPIELDMKPYTVEALTTIEQLRMGKAAAEGDAPAPDASEGKSAEGKVSEDTTEEVVEEGVEEEGAEKPEVKVANDDDEGLMPVHPDEYYKYQLRGVVVHTGTVQGGHYYSFIQERTQEGGGKWYRFNDSLISEFDPKDIEEECFGGNKGPRSWGGAANGYILFYDRVPIKQGVEAIDGSGLSFEAAAQALSVVSKFKKQNEERARVRVPSKIFHEIWQENHNYWRDRNVFDTNYFEFLWEMVNNSTSGELRPDNTPVDQVDLNVPSNQRDALTRLATRFFLMTLARAKNKDSQGQWIGKLKTLYKENVSSSVWLLSTLATTNKLLSFQYFFNCPTLKIRAAVTDIIAIAMENVSPLEQESYTKEKIVQEMQVVEMKDGSAKNIFPLDNRGYVVGYIDILIHYIAVSATSPKKAPNFFVMISKIAALGPMERVYLNSRNVLAMMIDLFLGSNSPHPELNPPRNSIQRSMPDWTEIFPLFALLIGEDGVDHLSPISQEMVGCDAFLQKLIVECSSFQRSKSISGMLMNMCKKNKENSAKIITIFKKNLEVLHHTQMRMYFRVMFNFASIVDELTTWRVDTLMTVLFEVIEGSSNVWKFVDFCFDHIIRMGKKIPTVLEWLQKHTEMLDFMIDWIRHNPSPPDGKSAGAMQLDRKINSAELVKSANNVEYCAFTHYGLSPLQKATALEIIKNGPIDTLGEEDAEDSDIERSERKFDVGSLVDCYDIEGNWLEGSVVSLGAKSSLEIGYKGFHSKYNEWVQSTSARLVEIGKYSSLDGKK